MFQKKLCTLSGARQYEGHRSGFSSTSNRLGDPERVLENRLGDMKELEQLPGQDNTGQENYQNHIPGPLTLDGLLQDLIEDEDIVIVGANGWNRGTRYREDEMDDGGEFDHALDATTRRGALANDTNSSEVNGRTEGSTSEVVSVD